MEEWRKRGKREQLKWKKNSQDQSSEGYKLKMIKFKEEESGVREEAGRDEGEGKQVG